MVFRPALCQTLAQGQAKAYVVHARSSHGGFKEPVGRAVAWGALSCPRHQTAVVTNLRDQNMSRVGAERPVHSGQGQSQG